MFIKIKRDENDLVIIQTLMTNSGYKDEEVEEVYEQLEEEMENVKKNGNLIILGDWNVVVGEGQEGEAVGKYGLLGVRNNRGKRLIEFANKGIYNYKHHLSTTSETPIHTGKVRWYSTKPNRLHHGYKET